MVAGEVTRAYVVHVPASYSPGNSEAAALVLNYNNYDNTNTTTNNNTGGGLPRLDPQRGHQHGPRALGAARRHRGRGLVELQTNLREDFTISEKAPAPLPS